MENDVIWYVIGGANSPRSTELASCMRFNLNPSNVHEPNFSWQVCLSNGKYWTSIEHLLCMGRKWCQLMCDWRRTGNTGHRLNTCSVEKLGLEVLYHRQFGKAGGVSIKGKLSELMWIWLCFLFFKDRSNRAIV